MRFTSAALAVAFSLSALSLSSSSAFADTLTLTGTGGTSADGVYVYPYLFTVTEGSQTATDVSLSCLNFDREITVGESWAVDEYSIPMGTGTLDGETYADYRADAWLFNQYSNTSYTATEVQFAIWDIMDPSGVQGLSGFDSVAQTLASEAMQAAINEPASYYAGDVLFIPDASGSSTWTSGQPQIFITNMSPIAPTPEPGSLMLLGSGLAAGAGLVRRRIRA